MENNTRMSERNFGSGRAVPIIAMVIAAVPVVYGLWCAVCGYEYYFWMSKRTVYGISGFIFGMLTLLPTAVIAELIFAVICLIVKGIKSRM